MLGGLYGDLPPPFDVDKPTNTTTIVWSIFAPPQTILKPQSKPKTTQNSLPTRPHSSPAIAPSPNDVVALPQPALVDATSTVIKEHDPARPNYEDYRREKKKKEVDAEISRELERRMQEEEEREMRERGAVQGTGSRVSSAVVGQEINNNPLASGSSEKRLEARPSHGTVEFNRTWLLHHFSSLQTHSLTVHVIRRSILVFLVCAR